MKRIFFILAILVGFILAIDAQTQLSGGIGYSFGENFVHPGFVLEAEYEPFLTEGFSLPLRVDFGYNAIPDYDAYSIDIHKGFRKYFKFGLFLEQSVGVGVIAKGYKTDYWYYDKYSNSVPHGNMTVWGFMPSVTAGVGYNLTKNQERQNLVWLRPKVYWDLGFRGLYLPYFALQVGYTHTFKTK